MLYVNSFSINNEIFSLTKITYYQLNVINYVFFIKTFLQNSFILRIIDLILLIYYNSNIVKLKKRR